MPSDKSVANIGCQRFQVLLARSLDGELIPAEGEMLDAHLANCPACREEMAELRALESLLEGLAERRISPSVDLVPVVMSRLPSRLAPSWKKVLHPIVVAASLLVAISAGYMSRDLFAPRGGEGVQQSVRIIFYSPEATSVALIGDFNEWGAREVTVARSSDGGMWEFTLSLDPGVYHYNLLVDGQRWAANPKSSTLVPDGFGGYDSVLVVSEKCQDDCS